MAASTGPVVATGLITAANGILFNHQPATMGIRVGVATAIAAGLLGLLEHGSQPLAVGIAWIGLITSLLITPRSGPSFVSNLLRATGF